MTLHVGSVGPPIRANTYEPEVLRQFIAIDGRSSPGAGLAQGVVGAGSMAVTQNGTPNMSVNVAAGFAVVAGTNNAPVQGAYNVYNDATVNLALAASNATNPRIDVVCVTVQDAYYSGATNTGLLQVITGTPGASPAVPAAPANSLVLAHIYVGANVSSVSNSNINSITGTGNPDTLVFVPQVFPAGLISKSGPITTGGGSFGTGQVFPAGYVINVYPNANRIVRITASMIWGGSSGILTANLVLYRDNVSTVVGYQRFQFAATSQGSTGQVAVWLDTPTSAVHQYFLGVATNSGTANNNVSATDPGYFMVEDLGPVS